MILINNETTPFFSELVNKASFAYCKESKNYKKRYYYKVNEIHITNLAKEILERESKLYGNNSYRGWFFGCPIIKNNKVEVEYFDYKKPYFVGEYENGFLFKKHGEQKIYNEKCEIVDGINDLPYSKWLIGRVEVETLKEAIFLHKKIAIY